MTIETSGQNQTTPLRASAVRVAAFTMLLLATTAAAVAAPAIRLSNANRVPACVTPERLMAFLTERNRKLDPRFRDIARWYKYWGEAWRVRWDYAFFQMALETNYLSYRRGDGQRGDVHETQNNFAGIGATGGGVRGERFPDVKTGVLAQVQHLVAYSGEKLAQPVAQRTQEKQNDIVDLSKHLGRPVTFTDLARRWATDRAYGRSIDTVAELFRKSQCSDATVTRVAAVPKPVPARRPFDRFAPPSKLGGPKLARLAGPDSLPWSGTTDAGTAAATPVNPAASQPAAKPGASDRQPVTAEPAAAPEQKSAAHHPPVRTIWSRQGVRPPAPLDVKGARTGTPKRDDAPGQNTTLRPASGPEPKAAAAETAPAAPPSPVGPAEAPPPPPVAVDEPVTLPEFKIKPSAPPPQYLGGPVPNALPSPRPATVATAVLAPKAAIRPARRTQEPAADERLAVGNPPPAPAPAGCRILTASYGGKKTLLVRAVTKGETRLTALTVIDGFEKSMFDIYARSTTPGAELAGTYANKEEALSAAHAMCPGS